MASASLMGSALHGGLVVGKYVALGTYAAPIVIWGAGTLEGVARTVTSLGQTALWGMALRWGEAAASWQQAKGDGKVALGCGMMTLLSALPVIGTFRAYERIVNESMKYSRIRSALEKSQTRAREQATEELYRELDRLDAANAGAMMERALRLADEHESRPEHFTKEELSLRRSLVHHYYLYTGCYLGLEKTCQGVEYGWRKTAEIAGRIFRAQLVKRALTFAWQNTVKATKVSWNSYVDEVNRVARLTAGTGAPPETLDFYWD